jgi:hypothetical protein
MLAEKEQIIYFTLHEGFKQHIVCLGFCYNLFLIMPIDACKQTNEPMTAENTPLTGGAGFSHCIAPKPPGWTNECGSTKHCGSTITGTWPAEFAILILDLARKIHPVKVRNSIPVTSGEFSPAALGLNTCYGLAESV